jgi:hypothetical protein
VKKPVFIVSFVVVVLTLLVGVGLLSLWIRRETAKEALWRHRRECKENLKAAFTAQKSYFQEYDRYATDFESVGFAPARGNHAAYVLRRDGPVAERKREVLPKTSGSTVVGVDEFMWARHSTAKLLAQLPATFAGGVTEGVSGTCPDCQVVMACVTEFEGEPGVTVWSVATFDRKTPDGQLVSSGAPVAEPR